MDEYSEREIELLRMEHEYFESLPKVQSDTSGSVPFSLLENIIMKGESPWMTVLK